MIIRLGNGFFCFFFDSNIQIKEKGGKENRAGRWCAPTPRTCSSGHKATAKLKRYAAQTIRSYLSTTSVVADTMESHGQIVTFYSYKGGAGRSMAAQLF
jgi:hypothetical protein